MEDELEEKGLETVSIFLEKLLPSFRRERMKAELRQVEEEWAYKLFMK